MLKSPWIMALILFAGLMVVGVIAVVVIQRSIPYDDSIPCLEGYDPDMSDTEKSEFFGIPLLGFETVPEGFQNQPTTYPYVYYPIENLKCGLSTKYPGTDGAFIQLDYFLASESTADDEWLCVDFGLDEDSIPPNPRGACSNAILIDGETVFVSVISTLAEVDIMRIIETYPLSGQMAK